MTIYFAASIRGGRNDLLFYKEIIDYLHAFGEVLTEHIGLDDILVSEGILSDGEIHDRDMKWLKMSDVIISEVTTPSLGVGYEIGRAIEMGKRILCLFRPQSGRELSAMIAGSKSVKNSNYENIEQVKDIIRNFLNTIECVQYEK